MLAEKKAAVDEAMAKMNDALEQLEACQKPGRSAKVNEKTNVPRSAKKARVKIEPRPGGPARNC